MSRFFGAMTLLVLLAASAGAATGPAEEACAPLPAEDGRACRSLEAAVDVTARLCRNADGAPTSAAGSEDADVPAGTSACDVVDGEPVDPARVDAYLASETHRALDAQFHAEDALPMRLARWPSTHNSFNAEVYAPTLSGLDANQRYSIYDQLRMDVRAIELDVHWWPSADGLGFSPVLCHAEDAGNGVHAGCTNERLFGKGLAELATFLRQDFAAEEVVLLYVEDHLDGKPEAYEDTAEALGGLGDAIFAPSDSGRACEDGLPLDLSRDDVRAHGRRLLVVASTCGPADGPWAHLVHRYDASIDQHGVEDFTPWPDCGGAGVAYGERIVRFWEDRTWLAYMGAPPQLPLTPEIAGEMMRCGVNMPGFDLLSPDDGRLAALVPG